MPSNLGVWPNRAIEHEIRSLRWYLGHNYPGDPPEIRYREQIFSRPSIFINLIRSRVEQDGQFHFYTIRLLAVTFYGSDDLNGYEREEESMIIFDWFSTTF